MSVRIFTSVTRISDLAVREFVVTELPRRLWADGDYVVCKVVGKPSALYRAELASGRVIHALPGDIIIGAFGQRAATLEGAGSWTAMDGNSLHAMTGAGLLGRFTSLSPLLPAPMKLEYRGHVVRDQRKVSMQDFAIQSPDRKLETPIVLLVGTSMSAGKTTTGRLMVHELASHGLNVVGVKLTGAGRYRDVLSFRDAGASQVFDFVDAGLPSTVVSKEVFLRAIRPLLSHIAGLQADVLIVEAGASPLEPYNGAAAYNEIRALVKCTVLCASDPYAVVGVQHAFGLTPDLVTGPAANTEAGVDLVKKLTGVDALNVLYSNCVPHLRKVLERTLQLDFGHC